MNALILYFIFLLQLKKFKGKSSQYNECIDLTKNINDSASCLNIILPESDGYTCCSMKITYNFNAKYNCFALENEYSKDQETLDDYISKINISSLFNSIGGNMEINCGNNLTIEKNYKKSSDSDYLNCYQYHIQGTENKDVCISNNIEDGSKCCFVETTQSNFGKLINDSRCYVIPKKYFEGDNNLTNYVLDQSNNDNLNDIKNLKITINCKDIETFNYNNLNEDKSIDGSNENNKKSENSEKSKNSENNEKKISEDSNSSESHDSSDDGGGNKKKKKKSKIGIIIIIVALIVLLIGLGIRIIFYFLYKKRTPTPINTVNGMETEKNLSP